MARKIEYQIGFTADTNQLQTALKQAATALQDVGNNASNRLTADLRNAADAALQLETHLKNAYNVETGKLDLSKFSQSLSQSGMTLEQYRLRLSTIGVEGEQAFLKVAQAIAAAELPMRRSNAALDKLWITMKNTLRWQLTSGMLHGFIGAVQTAYGYTQDLNESLNSIRIVTQKSVEDMDKFAVKANEAAQTLSTTTTRYTDAALIYYQQGLTDEEVEGRVQTTIKLANAAGESAETASQQLTAVWNNFYDGTKSLEYYADVMTALGATTASSTQEISQGLQKFAAVADTVGLSYEYAAAALATVTATTRESADIVGTAFRTLFGRLESLKLGESLDDGTTLNKYSQALKSVGVDIKDVSGNLKDMDDILTGTGEKWQTLSRDQQMALAQTVAGVRQYSQFIALMDNWDFFQENLQTALGAEGSLQKQADIYAESWEAARDRVRAAAEEIYGDIIDDEKFIDLANGLATVLNRVDDVVVSLGGLKGILNTVLLLTTTLYGDKIAAAINNQVYNLSQMMGIEAQLAIQTQQRMMAQAQNTSSEIGLLNELSNTQISVAREAMEIDIEITRASRDLTASQMEQINNEKELVQAISKRTESYMEMARTARDANNSIKESIRELDPAFNQSTFDTNFVGNRANQRNLVNALGLGNYKDYDAGMLDTVIDRYEELRMSAARLAEQQRTVGETSGRNSAEYLALSNQIRSVNAQSGVLLTVLRSYDGLNINQIVGTFRENAESMGTSTQRATLELEHMRQKAQDVAAAINYASNAGRDFGTIVNDLAGGLMSLQMAITGVQSLGRVFSDEDMDAGQRLTTTLSSLISLSFAFSRAHGMISKAVGASTAAEVISNQVLTALNANQTTGITITAQDGLSKLQAAVATKILADAEGKLTIEIAERNAMMAAGLVGLLPYIAIFAAVAGAIYLGVKAYNADADAAKEAAKAHEEAAKAATEAKDAYSGLTKTIEDYDKAVAAVNDLTSGTEEYTEAVETANEKARELLETYKELKAYSHYENGLLIIDEDALKRVQDLAKQRRADAYVYSNYTDLAAQRAQDTASRTSAMRALNANLGMFSEKVTEAEFDNIISYIMENSDLPQLNNITRNFTGWDVGTFNKGIEATKDQLFALAEALKETEKNAEALAIEMARSSLSSNDAYTALTAGQQDAVAAIVGRRNLTEDQLLERQKQLQPYYIGAIDEYAKAMGYDSGSGSRNFWSGKYTFTKNGEVTEAISLDSMANYLAAINAVNTATEEVTDSTIEFVDEVAKAGQKIGGQKVENELLGFLSGDKKIDSTAFSPQQIAEFRKGLDDIANISSDAWEGSGFESADAYCEAVRKALDNYDAQAWEQAVYDKYMQIANTGRKALEFMADTKKGGLLDEDTIQALQQQFAGIFDFSNLGTLSLKDQVLSVTEALRTLDDPTDAIAAMKKRVELIDDYEKKISDARRNSTRALFQGDREAREEAKAAIKEYKDELNDLTLGVDSKEAKRQLEKQIEELNKIEPITLKVEIDRASAEALLGTMQRAAKLVEKDFTVTADNVAELASLMPEYFENATIDAATGLVQLDKDSVQAMTDIAIAAAGLNRQAAIDLLSERVQTTSAELAIMRGMYDQINIASADSAVKQIEDAGYTEQQVGMASKKTLMNKIKDFLDEADAHGSLSSKEVQDQNKVAEASAEQGKITALNWHQAAEDIYSSLHSAFVNAKANADQFKNDELIQDYKGAISNVNLTGYQRSASATSWTYEVYNSQYKALRDFYNAGGNFSEMDFEGWSDEAVTAFAVELADQIGEVLGEGSDFSTSDIYKLDDKYIAEVGKTINQSDYADLFDRIVNARSDLSQEEKNRLAQAALAGGISYGDYTLGQLFKDLATYAGLDVNNLFKKDKSGSSRTPTQKLDEEKQEEEEERYHRINRLIKEQDRLLDNLATEEERAYGTGRLKIFEDEIKEINQQVDYYKEKLDEAQNTWLPKDVNKVKELFSNADIQGGVITNVDKLIDDSIDKYNAVVKTYNDWITNTWNTASAEAQQTLKETKEVYDHALKEAKALYDREQKALDQYEETIDLIRELQDDIADKMREERDKELEGITYKMEVVLDLKQLKQDVNNFMKDIAESYGDALTHTLDNANFRGVAGLMTDNAQLELDTFASYVEEYNKLKEYAASNEGYDDIDATRQAMEDLTHNIIDSGEALLEWIDYWENMVPEAVDAARERFNQFTDQLEHNITVLDTIKELYALQGVTLKTQQGFNQLQRVSQERMEAQLANSVLNRKWYERAAADLQNAQNELDSYLANGGTEYGVEYDYLKNARDAFLIEFNEAQEAYLKSAQEAMETARDMYVQQIERAAYEFAQAATPSGDLDFWGEQYDHFIEGEEHYLDAVNRAYQERTWSSKIQLDYDNDLLRTHHDLIKAFEDEKNALFARNKINEYDLEVLEAKYKVLQAQMALEDAENAKNNLQLVRDRQGNWNYRYTSNPDDIAAAQQDLADAQNDWYNIAKQQTKDVTGEIVATWKEAQDAIREIWEDDELDEAEKSERSLELQRYYSEKMQDLYNDRAQAMADMTEAGMNNLTDYENKYELTLTGMTSDNEDFQKALNEYLDLCREDFREYESTIDSIATETHTDLDSMKRDVDNVSESTDKLKKAGEECATTLWNQIDKIYQAGESYRVFAEKVEAAIGKLRELAIMQANDIEGYSGTSIGPTLTSSGGTLADYSMGMIYAAAKYGYGSAEYNRIAAARDVKWNDDTRVTEEQRETWKTTEQWNQELKDSTTTVEEFGEKFGEGAIDAIEKWLKNPSSYDTGGYTGSWGATDGKLAVLHEKELVLNQTDTANILAAVDGVRAIEQALDHNAAIALGSLIMRLGGYVAPAAVEQSSDTTNHFDVYFPNVTDHNEIELAIRNLELDADQYVNRRTD